MNIAIFTECGRGIGFGHLMRCIAVRDALVESKVSVDIYVDVVECEVDVGDYGAHQMAWVNDGMDRQQVFLRYDLVLFDSYRFDEADLREFNELPVELAFFDDTNRLPYQKGILINGALNAEKIYGDRRDTISYCLGTSYTALRQSFWSVPDYAVREELGVIFISLGGSVLLKRVKAIEECLRAVSPMKVINVHTMNDVLTMERMRENMMMADVCISGGGQTLYELARCGVPTIGVEVAENQKHNLDAWERVGFLQSVGSWEESMFLDKLCKSIEQIKDVTYRNRCSSVGRAHIDGQGARRIAAFFLQKVSKA